MDESGRCQYCGKPIGPKAVGALCPECLMKVGLGSGVQPGAGEPKAQPVAPPPEEIAQHFPQLEILSLLGQGGMGFVYKAHQKNLERTVALKILPPTVGDDPTFAQRFASEAKALAKLNHPGIVTIYEFGKANGLFYFLMEFVDGVNLRQLQANGRISAREALAIVPQICDALQYAHDQGIVHRDIKPENILLDRKGRVKVADFGIARLMAPSPIGWERAGVRAACNPNIPPSLTEAGKVIGTPQYMAPEQKDRPSEVDHRADIYSLGVVLYQMLTGELPGKSIEPPSKKVQLDVRLDEVVLRALEQEPERRYQQASQFKTHVETIAQTPLAGGSGREEAKREKSEIEPSRLSAGAIMMMTVVLIYTVEVLGVTSLSVLQVGSATMWMIFLFLGSALGSLVLALAVRDHGKPATQRRLLKTTGILAFIMALPLAGFSVFFLYQLIQERGAWNPARDEAVIVPLIWFGTLLLPIFGLRLLRAGSSHQNINPGLRAGTLDKLWADPKNWRARVIYICKQDPRIIVPKRMKWGGWTLNFAHPSAWLALLVCMLSIIVSVVGLVRGGRGVWYAFLAGIITFWCVLSGVLSSPERFETRPATGPANDPASWSRRLSWLIPTGLALLVYLCAVLATSLFLARPGAYQGPPVDQSSFGEVRYRVFEVEATNVDRLVPSETRERSDGREEGLIYGGSPPNAVSQTAEVQSEVISSMVNAGTSSARTNLFIDKRQTVFMWPKMADSESYGGSNAVGGLGGFVGFKNDDGQPQLRIQYNVTHIIPARASVKAEILYEGRAPLPAWTRAFFIPFTPENGSARYVVVAFDIPEPQSPRVAAIQSVVVSKDKVVVKQRKYNGEGLLFMCGAMTNRWEPRHLDSLFAVTLEPHWLGHGASWVIRSHGPMGYNLDTPAGTIAGHIVFHSGTPVPEADGSYVVAEFQPEGPGAPGLPIAVKLVTDKSALGISHPIDVAIPAASTQPATSFGPVIERVLHDTEEKLGYEALDLLNGKFLSFPREASADGDWLPPWLETNRVDLIARREDHGWYLLCVKTKLSDFAHEAWARATPADCAAALQSGTSLQQLDDNTVDEATTRAGAVIYRLPPPTQLPRTLALQTREGVQGLLQLTGFMDNPLGLKIHYKLVQTGADVSHTNANESANGRGVQNHAPSPVAMFSPYSGRIEGLPIYALTNTLIKPRHVVLAEFQIVDERHSVSFSVSQLSYYLFSAPDAASRVSAALRWRVENVEEGQGAWSVVFDGEVLGARIGQIHRKILVAGDKPFMRPPVLVPGLRDNPDFGPEIGLDPKTVTWTPARSQRTFMTGTGDWSERDYNWHTLSLFEATDRQGRIVATMRLQLLVCPLQTGAQLPGTTSILRNGSWRDDKELKSLLLDRALSGTNEKARTGQHTNSVRTFALRHMLASQMADELRSVLLGKPGTEAKPSEDNLSLTVTAPPDVLIRVATFIAIQDWPQKVTRGSNFYYRRDTPENTARAFFYACSTEDVPEAISRMLSVPILAQLNGMKLPELWGSPVDPKIVQELRGNWDGRDAAVRKVMNAWNKYPLRQLREDPGVAMGFGIRRFASASFEGTPEDFTHLSFIHDGNGNPTNALVIDTLPPWFSLSEARKSASARFSPQPGSSGSNPIFAYLLMKGTSNMENPAFQVVVTNSGPEDLSISGMASLVLDVDGKAHPPRVWMMDGADPELPFGPGKHYNFDFSVADFSVEERSAEPLKLTPGHHTIRVALLNNSDASTRTLTVSLNRYSALAISNPIGVEIGAKPQK